MTDELMSPEKASDLSRTPVTNKMPMTDAPKDHVGPQPRKQERSHQRNERRDGNP